MQSSENWQRPKSNNNFQLYGAFNNLHWNMFERFCEDEFISENQENETVVPMRRRKLYQSLQTDISTNKSIFVENY